MKYGTCCGMVLALCGTSENIFMQIFNSLLTIKMAAVFPHRLRNFGALQTVIKFFFGNQYLYPSISI